MAAELNCEFSDNCWQGCPRLHEAVLRTLGFSSLAELTYEAAELSPGAVMDSVNKEFSDFRADFDPLGSGSKEFDKEPGRYEYILQFSKTCRGPKAAPSRKDLVPNAGYADPHTFIPNSVCGRGVRKIGYLDNKDRTVHMDPDLLERWV